MTTAPATRPTTPSRRRAALALRVVAAGGLAVHAYVHLRLAPVFDALGTQVTQGMLFRLEAAVALLAAVAVLASDRRLAWAAAGLAGGAGLAAVVLTTYVRVPAIGPFPAVHDPSWSADKITTLVATAVVLGAWAVREAVRRR